MPKLTKLTKSILIVIILLLLPTLPIHGQANGYVNGSRELTGTLSPAFLGPLSGSSPAVNDFCLVDIVVHLNVASCVGLGTQLGGVIIDPVAIQRQSVTPFTQTQSSYQVYYGVGVFSTGGSHPCGAAHPTCMVLDVPYVLKQTRLYGSGPVIQVADPSTGTEFTYSITYPTPIGVTPVVSVTCQATGGALSNGNYDVTIVGYNNLNSNPFGLAIPGPDLHSPNIPVTCSNGGATQALVVTSPPVQVSSNTAFNSQEFYGYSTVDYSGFVNVVNSAVGNCPAGATLSCISFTSFNNAGINTFGDILGDPVGTIVTIGGANAVITGVYAADTFGVSPQLTPASGTTFNGSLGAWQQNRIGSGSPVNSCTGGSAGAIDPSGCTLASTSMLMTSVGDGTFPPEVSLSNPAFVAGDGNSSSIVLNTSMQNYGFKCTNGETQGVGVDNNVPQVIWYGNTAQEGGYDSLLNYSGACGQDYFYFANSGPNYAVRDGITGGGPGFAGGAGFSGNATVSTSSVGACPSNGGFPAGSCVTITSGNNALNWNATNVTFNGSTVATIGQVYTPTLFSVTSVPTGGTWTARGLFWTGIIDGAHNPTAIANGSARKIENLSTSDKSGANVRCNWLVLGPNADVTFDNSHVEQSVSTGYDGFCAMSGATVTVLGDKHQYTNALLHLFPNDVTQGGGGSVIDVKGIGGSIIAEDDNPFYLGIGNCNGAKSHCAILKSVNTIDSGSFYATSTLDVSGLTNTGNVTAVGAANSIPNGAAITATAFIANNTDLVCRFKPVVHSPQGAVGFWADIYWVQTGTINTVSFGLGMNTNASTARVITETCLSTAGQSQGCTTPTVFPSTGLSPTSIVNTTTITAITTTLAEGSLTNVSKTHVSGSIIPGNVNDVQMSLYGITQAGADPLNILATTRCELTP
jgi:hypothetical protein